MSESRVNPKVSVIMPIYNAERFVETAIQSILRQTFTDFELILVNDHPTDRTMDVVRSIHDERIRIVENDRNRGISYSRNHGIEEARGEYIALMDDDDISTLDRIRIENEILDIHPELGAVAGAMNTIDEYGFVIEPNHPTLHNPDYIQAFLMFYCCIPNGSTMFRKKTVMEQNIRFRDNCMGMEDYHFWVDFTAVAGITIVDDVFLSWRVSRNSETTVVKEQKKEERAKKYAEIQRHALEVNGFRLSDEMFKTYSEIFTEGDVQSRSMEDLFELQKVLREIIVQAVRMNKRNKAEVMKACRNFYTRLVRNSSVWSLESEE